jgi:hypothetical protein
MIEMNMENCFALLQKTCEPGTPIFLLIDPIVGDVLAQPGLPIDAGADSIRQAREAAWQRPVYLVELFSGIKLPLVLHPYLILLEGPQDSWLEEIVGLARDEREQTWKDGIKGQGKAIHKVGGWLRSTMDGENLAKQLSQWMRLNCEIHTPEKYLRLGDSRVLALMAAVVGEEALVSALGGVHEWLYLDAYGKLRSLKNPEAHIVERNALSLLPKLTAEQWQRMKQGPVIHEAIARVFGQWCLEDVFLRQQDKAVPYAAALDLAQRFAPNTKTRQSPISITTQADQVGGLILGLLHPGWENLPEVREYFAVDGSARVLSEHCAAVYLLAKRALTPQTAA